VVDLLVDWAPVFWASGVALSVTPARSTRGFAAAALLSRRQPPQRRRAVNSDCCTIWPPANGQVC